MTKKEPLYIYIPTIIDSLNKTNTTHWTKKKKSKDAAILIINEELKKYSDYKFSKVHLSFQCILGRTTDLKPNGKKVRDNSKRDVINNAPSIKLIEDCIVRAGMLIDDTGEYVVGHTIYADYVDRTIKGSGMLIKIEEVEESNKNLVNSFNELFRSEYKLEK